LTVLFRPVSEQFTNANIFTSHKSSVSNSKNLFNEKSSKEVRCMDALLFKPIEVVDLQESMTMEKRSSSVLDFRKYLTKTLKSDEIHKDLPVHEKIAITRKKMKRSRYSDVHTIKIEVDKNETTENKNMQNMQNIHQCRSVNDLRHVSGCRDLLCH
jgi:hypothetical protein